MILCTGSVGDNKIIKIVNLLPYESCKHFLAHSTQEDAEEGHPKLILRIGYMTVSSSAVSAFNDITINMQSGHPPKIVAIILC